MIHKHTLIIDSNYICYRSMLKLKGLSYDEYPTGVIYGFLRQIQTLVTKFPVSEFIFTWDSGKSYRREAFPGYKKREPNEDPEIAELISVGKPQFGVVRRHILPLLGFRNNFIQTGVEADDLMAQIVFTYWKEKDKMVIVSGDNDLYQLLQPDVIIYDPLTKTTTTEADFVKEKGIPVKDWPWVKAVGGCNSDKVKGPPGIAEKTALQYLRGEPITNRRRALIDGFDPTFNLSLVKLPHEKSTPVTLVKDELNIQPFEGLCLDFGFSSLLKKDNYTKWKQILRSDQ